MHEMQGIPNLTIGPFCFIGRCVTGFHHGVLHGLHRPQLSASPAVDAEFTPPRLTPDSTTQGVEPCQGQVTPCPKPPSEDSLSSPSVEAEGSFARKDNTSYGIRTRDLRLERAASKTARRTRLVRGFCASVGIVLHPSSFVKQNLL